MEEIKSVELGELKLALFKIVNSVPGVTQTVTYQVTVFNIETDEVKVTYPHETLPAAEKTFAELETRLTTLANT